MALSDHYLVEMNLNITKHKQPSKYTVKRCIHTHIYLGPLIGQQQLYVRDFKFLWNAYRSCNAIVKTCMNNAVYNSNTCIGYKFFS